MKYEAVDDHATHGGPLNGLTEFAEYLVASVTSNSMTLKNTDGTSLTYGNTGGGATGVELASELSNAMHTLAAYGYKAVEKQCELQITFIEASERILKNLPQNISEKVN